MISSTSPFASAANNPVLAARVEQRIHEALERSAEVDADRISVTLHGDRAVLRGSVRSWAEHLDAERAALETPGIRSVDNQLALIVKATVHRD